VCRWLSLKIYSFLCDLFIFVIYKQKLKGKEKGLKRKVKKKRGTKGCGGKVRTEG
jgi:hypothetical protein